MNMPKISVITVVWNDAAGLERTIQSVIGQTYTNVEFIIIDGASTDGTVDVIKKYEGQIDYWISEKDNGIYDAMNKGIRVANGTWVNFMNAGDIFVNDSVLKSVDFKKYSSQVLLYGKKIQDEKVIIPLEIEKLEIGEIHANHQSMFFNKELLYNELVYDTRYKIYADYELVNRIYKKDKSLIEYIDLTIADFEGHGVSSIPSFQKRKDKYLIIYSHYGLKYLIKSMIYRIIK